MSRTRTTITTRTLTGAATVALAIALAVSAGTGCAAKGKTASGDARDYAFWPAAPDVPRIQFLRSFNTSQDVAPQRSGFQDLVYGTEQEQVLAVAKPYGVALWDGRIYLTDVRGKGVIVLDLKRQQTRVMGATGTGAVAKAVDVVVSPADGLKYVVDPVKASIFVYDADERFVQELKVPGANPISCAVHGDLLYLTDFKNRDVKVVNRRTGQLLRTIGGGGGEDGKFIGPLKVTTDRDGNVFVTDTVKCRVQKFTPAGELVMAYGATGNVPGSFTRPKHVAVASDGVQYVVDASFNNVQLFDEEGKALMFFGSDGGHPGAMNLPAGLAISESPSDLALFADYVHPAFQAERIVVVTNQFGPSKVSVYAMGQLKSDKTLADISNDRANVAPGTVDPNATAAAPPAGTTRPTAAPAAGAAAAARP
jgi:hypothetical protein